MNKDKVWVEVSKSALGHNLEAFKKLCRPARVMAVVKSNAYGHGLVEVATAVKNQADWFGVDNVDEALTLRRVGIKKPILILGYTRLDRLADAIRHDVSFVAYSRETVMRAARDATERHPARLHLKLETGLTRQGIHPKDLSRLVTFLTKGAKVKIEGVSTHFANIEDTTDSSYAKRQLKQFAEGLAVLRAHGIDPPFKHTACSAAALLFPQTRFNLIRLGISLYGLWSSDSTRRSAVRRRLPVALKPALAWKTIVAQVKQVKKGTPVSYGLTERVKRDSKIAVLPIGYWDGYDRAGMSGRAEVLVHGRRCKIIGRVCMNMCMADVTGVPNVKAEDEVVLLGRQGRQNISAEELAQKAGTINYEIVTRINPTIPRMVA